MNINLIQVAVLTEMKLRLVMHWTLDIKFSGDVHVYLKGLSAAA